MSDLTHASRGPSRTRAAATRLLVTASAVFLASAPAHAGGGEDCKTATVIPSLPFFDTGTTLGFLDDFQEVCPFAGPGSPDVVYLYVPPVDQVIDISLCGNSNYDTMLYVYQDLCGEFLVDCNDDLCATPAFPEPFVSGISGLPVSAGSAYFIVVDGYGGNQGDFTLDVQVFDPTGQGACCFDDSSCVDGLDQLACADNGGVFQGPSTTCSNVQCLIIDCNANGIPDQFDILKGFSPDVDGNGIPDECDVDVIFCQLNWLDGAGGYVSQFSDWGQAGIRLDSTNAPFLFEHVEGGLYGWINIVTNVDGLGDNWAIKNLPVFVTEPQRLDGQLRRNISFNLTSVPGDPVLLVDYQLSITPEPIGEPDPTGPRVFSATIVQYDVLFGGGKDPESENAGSTANDGPWENPAENFGNPVPEIRILCPAETITVDEDDVEEVDEEINGCGPGSVTRSSMYLDIGLTDTAAEMYRALRDAMDTIVGDDPNGGTYEGPDNPDDERGLTGGKEDYLIANGLGNKIVTTTTTDFDTVAECLADGADVELFVSWGDGNGAHFAFVSSMQAVKNGKGDIICWFVDIIDDPEQGDETAENKKTSLKFNADGTLDQFGDNARVLNFIVEKKVDEEITCGRVTAKLERGIQKLEAMIADLPADPNERHDQINDVIIQIQGAIRQLQGLAGGDSIGCAEGIDYEAIIASLELAVGRLLFVIENPLPPDVIIVVLAEVIGLLEDALDALQTPPCPWDFNGNGAVDFQDLLLVLSNWGPCAGCPQDLDGNNVVNFQDLLELLSNWGPCQ